MASLSDPDSLQPAPIEPIPDANPIPWSGEIPEPLSENDMLLAGSTRGAAWLDIVRVIVFVVLFDLLMGSVLGLIIGMDAESSADPGQPGFDAAHRSLFLPILGFRAAAAIAIILVIVRVRRQSALSLGLSRKGLVRNALIGTAATAVVYGLIILVMPILVLIWPKLTELLSENAERILDAIPRLHPVGFVGVALVVGVYEELFFRGFLMTRIRRATNSWFLAVIVSTAVFSLLHMADQTAPAVVFVTILSLVFSLVTIWRRSIIPAIVGHFLFNLSQFLWLYFQAGDSWT